VTGQSKEETKDMSAQSWNPWKMTAIGMGLVMVTALVTGVVVAQRSSTEADKPAADAKAPETRTTAPSSSRPASPHREAPRVQPSAAVAAPAPPVASSPQTAPVNVAQGAPTASAVDECNRYAAEHTTSRDKTMDTVKNAGVGALVGAAVGAAGGAIADGKKGAGKGAAIGGILGAGGGTVYGLNENRKHDEAYREAYASCMRSRGFSG
jgi:type IV secretory pathway VirB10-like protein